MAKMRAFVSLRKRKRIMGGRLVKKSHVRFFHAEPPQKKISASQKKISASQKKISAPQKKNSAPQKNDWMCRVYE